MQGEWLSPTTHYSEANVAPSSSASSGSSSMQVPSEELPILEQLVTLRNRLTALKTHQRKEFVRTSDVLDIYNQALKQVEKLNEVREKAQEDTPESSSQGGETVLNRVDYTLNDVFQLVSLFFLSIGKGREAPATICQLATLKRLLVRSTGSSAYIVHCSHFDNLRITSTSLESILKTISSHFKADWPTSRRSSTTLRMFRRHWPSSFTRNTQDVVCLFLWISWAAVRECPSLPKLTLPLRPPCRTHSPESP